ncbi:MAG TPA: hypothetical protein VN781_08350 [Acidimicrobiales bacterium]|nr:hypothetical protein [Acidimicrobiales bacterium]
MTPLAVYILEQAQKAHSEQLSELQFLADFDSRLLGATKVRLPNIATAIAEIRQGGQWPWPAPSEVPAIGEDDQERGELAARRQAVVLAIRESVAASEDLTYLLGHRGSDMSDVIGQVERGMSALDVSRSMCMADRREVVNAATSRLRLARHNFQRAIFLLAIAEGSSLAEIGRTWRVSRQLVSRMTKEKDQSRAAAATDY